MATMARAHASDAQTTTSTTTTEREAPKSILDRILDEQVVNDVLRPLLPRGQTMGRIEAGLRLLVKKYPDLEKCTRTSLVDCIAEALRLDLDIGREFYIVPFSERYKDGSGTWKSRHVATGVVYWKANAALAIRTGAIRSIEVHPVYEAEVFEMEHGLNPIFRHVKVTDADERGPMIGAYYFIKLPHGEHLYDFLPIADIDAVRAKSKQWSPEKVKECPAWWARKRAANVGLGLVPKNPRHHAALVQRLAADERLEFDDVGERLAALDAIEDDEVDDMPLHPPIGARSRAVSTAGYGTDDAPITRATALATAGEILAGEPDPYDLDEAEGHHASTFDAAGSEDDDDAQGEPTLALDEAPRPTRRRSAIAEGR